MSFIYSVYNNSLTQPNAVKSNDNILLHCFTQSLSLVVLPVEMQENVYVSLVKNILIPTCFQLTVFVLTWSKLVCKTKMAGPEDSPESLPPPSSVESQN